MNKDEIAKLPTPKTDTARLSGWLDLGNEELSNAEYVPCCTSRSLEQRLAAAVMALETILMHEREMFWPDQRETLAAIKGDK